MDENVKSEPRVVNGGAAPEGRSPERTPRKRRRLTPSAKARRAKSRAKKKQWRERDEASANSIVRRVELDECAVESVSAIAAKVGLVGIGFDEMAQTWMRPIVDEGLGATQRGLNRARAVVKYLGGLIEGRRHRVALEDAGLTWGNVSALCRLCPDLKKVYDEACEIQREAVRREIGEAVEESAVELATKGAEVYNSDGKVVGRKRSEKMIELLLPQAGPEYAKAKGAAAGGGDVGGGVTLNFHFDGKGRPNVEAVKSVDAEVVDG